MGLARGSVLGWSTLLALSCAAPLLHCGEEPATTPSESVRSADADAGDAAGPVNPELLPFEAVPPHVYVSKVKNLLTGLPATDEEIKAVAEDPAFLKDLIDVWADSPQGERKLTEFLGTAFQQTQLVDTDFVDLIGGDNRLPDTQKGELLANVKESFARTAFKVAREGKNFSELVRTPAVLMTPALMALYALIDIRHSGDDGKLNDKWSVGSGKNNGYRVQNTTPVALSASIDPASPNYMNFYTAGDLGAGCTERVYAPSAGNSVRLARFFLGLVEQVGPVGGPCDNQKRVTPIFTPEDFTTWKAVTVRKPTGTERRHDFWDVARLRADSELLLDIPRVGFFSTLAFQAGWRTNSSNQARVTINQTLIVALGYSIESENSTQPLSETGLDKEHADPTSPCYGCHRVLDPMRPYFRRNLTLSYHEQLDPKMLTEEGSFSIGATQAKGATLDDFAKTLQGDEHFAMAWVQKLCFWADSAGANGLDPEALRIAEAFRASSFDFRVLLREVLASPLVTAAKATRTFQEREPLVSIARYGHLCEALKNRLGVDACAMNTNAQQIALNIPRDGYGRGAESPILTSDVSLFFRTSTENLCREVAAAVVETPQARWSSKNVDGAIVDFVRVVMGLPASDPRHGPSVTVLKEHHAAAIAAKAKPIDALRSTFVLACTAPSAVSIGL